MPEGGPVLTSVKQHRVAAPHEGPGREDARRDPGPGPGAAQRPWAGRAGIGDPYVGRALDARLQPPACARRRPSARRDLTA